MTNDPAPINIDFLTDELDGGREFLRVWRGGDGSLICIVEPKALGPDPYLFGIALVDCVNHGAIAWGNATGEPAASVRDRIWEGLDAERENPTDGSDF